MALPGSLLDDLFFSPSHLDRRRPPSASITEVSVTVHSPLSLLALVRPPKISASPPLSHHPLQANPSNARSTPSSKGED